MLKKLCLSLAFATISMTASNQYIDRISAIQTTLAHIAQEKKTIFLELQKTVTLGKKAILHMQEQLKEAYAPLASEITMVINTIIASEEFSASLNKVTDFQAICIANRAIHFDDIPYNSADYSIGGRINSELSKAFPSLDEQTERLFNIHYVTLANLWGCQLLLKKLEHKEQELNEEMKALEEPTNQTFSE